ncbi:hypothetical protein EDC01DRAFT_702745 [Geopyxis carbonaria]|nr:hypothetical protein EDC01DRAFT_702745 [Geopyxis carbonaria]
MDSQHEPIAIIGMACRFSGGATTPSKLWDLLSNQRTGHGPIPAHRFNIDSFYHSHAKRPGSISVQDGYFLSSDERCFDAGFFGLRTAEAESMDPQQRQLLEVVYECFESAGIPLNRVQGSDTGVFVGNFLSNFSDILHTEPEYPKEAQFSGKIATLVSNRISYWFDLHGPSFTLDTACSSSLYGLNSACQSLLSGECSAAIVGGTNLTTTPECMIDTSSAGLLSPSGRCQTFDAAADGYGKGDGIGAVLIKRLSDAIRDGDPVRALVRATAVNSCGRTPGIGHPGLDGQERVIRRAYAIACPGGLNPVDTQFLECHGTGTAMGDPLEVQAASRVFSPGRSADKKLVIGSVKPNLGHTEAASGIASIIKIVLALERATIPATPGVKTLNPEIDFDGSHFKVATKNTPWPETKIRRASVNSFGYGGSNAHAILESSEESKDNYRYYNDGCTRSSEDDDSIGSHLLVFSAHQNDNLKGYISQFSGIINRYEPKDLAYTLNVKRSHHRHRAYVVVNNSKTKIEALPLNNIVYGKKQQNSAGLVFVFTGQGAQWARMGAGLLAVYPSFRETICGLDKTLQLLPNSPNWKIEDVLQQPSGSSPINNPEVSQPVCTAVQLALVELLSTWNITPQGVIGHSSGEIAAAEAAGYISREEAIVLAYNRGIAVTDKSVPDGAMMALGTDEQSFIHIINTEPVYEHKANLTIACYNSHNSLTISGTTEAIAALGEEMKKKQIFHRILETGGRAYHSPAMHVVGDKYELLCWKSLDALQRLPENLKSATSGLRPKKHLFSSVTGAWVDLNAKLSPTYWRSNLESPVRFLQALKVCQAIGRSLFKHASNFVEIGPHPALSGQVKQVIGTSAEYYPSLIRKRDDVDCMLKLVGELHLLGYPVDLGMVSRPGRTIIDLPFYNWDHSKLYWTESRGSQEWRQRQHSRHDILGSQIPATTKSPRLWRNILRPRDVGWLRDHQVGTQIVFPATGFLAMAVESVSQLHTELRAADAPPHTTDISCFRIRDFVIKSAMMVPEEEGVEVLFELANVQITSISKSATKFGFKVSSLVAGQHQENASGVIEIDYRSEFECSESTPTLGMVGETDMWYGALSRVGLRYGPTFQGLSNIRTDGIMASAKTRLSPTSQDFPDESPYILHPATMDTCLQLSIVAACNGFTSNLDRSYLPVSAEEIVLWVPPRDSSGENVHADGFVTASAKKCGFKAAFADIKLVDSTGRPLFEVVKLRCKSLDVRAFGGNPASQDADQRHPYFREVWRPDFHFITPHQWEEMFPVGIDNENVAEVYTGLDYLTSLIILQTVQRCSGIAASRPDIWSDEDNGHMQYFWQWLKRQSKLINSSSRHLSLNNMTSEERETRIHELVDSFTGLGRNEAQLVNQVYCNIEQILDGKSLAIEVVNKYNLWAGFFNDSFSHAGSYIQLERIAKILGHQNPTIKILEIGGGTGGASKIMLKALDGHSSFRQYQKYTFTDVSSGFFSNARKHLAEFSGVEYKVLDIDDDPTNQGFEYGSYDLVIAGNVLHATKDPGKSIQYIRNLLKDDGYCIILEQTTEVRFGSYIVGGLPGWWQGDTEEKLTPLQPKDSWVKTLQKAGFLNISTLNDYKEPYSLISTMIARVGTPRVTVTNGHNGHTNGFVEENRSTSPNLYIIHSGQNLDSYFLEELGNECNVHGFSSQYASLDDVTQIDLEGANVIFIEAWRKTSLLLESTQQDLDNLKHIVSNAKVLLWLTSGGLVRGDRPEFATTLGFCRSLRMEHPSLKLAVLDFSSSCDEERTSSELSRITLNVFSQNTEKEPYDLFELKGVLYNQRIHPDIGYNSEITQKKSNIKELISYEHAQVNGPIRLDIETPGLFDSIFFRKDDIPSTKLEPGWVDIKTHAAGINMKDVINLMGNLDQDYLSLEAAGVVTAIGSGVTNLRIGDRVLCVCLAHFGTNVRTKAAFCVKLEDDESFTEMAAMPVVYGTAMYCLLTKANLRSGMSVLIHAAAGGVGLAAVQIAKLVGAEVYVTVGNEAKKKYLIETFAIPEDHIFNSRNTSFAKDLMKATQGSGVDVTLSSVMGELLHETVACVKPLGIHIEIGQKDLIDHGNLDLHLFLRSQTFFHFYMLELLNQEHLMTTLLEQMMQLYREKKIKPLSITQFHITEVKTAMRLFAEGRHIGKIVLNYEQGGEKLISTKQPPRNLKLRPDAAYILVGCLGGLGQRLALHMVRCGARELIFLSRSGKQSAEPFIKKLEELGTKVSVVQGDVSKQEAVVQTIQTAVNPVRGVVHAAMQLKDKNFFSMTEEDMQSCLEPKVTGSWLLHTETLHIKDLDFFVMTSSMSGILGGEAQSNYSAANVYLDTLARHRRSLGLAATSVALGRIAGYGYVANQDHIQKFLKRQGFYALEIDEFLKTMELAMMDSFAKVTTPSNSDALLLTGLEPSRLEALLNTGEFSAYSLIRRDPRFSLIFQALDNSSTAESSSQDSTSRNSGLLANLICAVPDADVDKRKDLIRTAFLDIFGKSVGTTTADAIDCKESGAHYGLDSMSGSELRTWIFSELAVDIPLLKLLSPVYSIEDLVGMIFEGFVANTKK